VAILPFLERQDLYGQYRFDEPWDSAHNKKLIAKIALSDVSSSFAMEQIKYTTALPLEFAVLSDG
jgi:hypothetical protein